MVSITQHKRKGLHFNSSSIFKSIALSLVLVCTFILYATHDLVTSSVPPGAKLSQRLLEQAPEGVTFEAKTPPKKKVLAKVINIDPDSSSSESEDGNDDDAALQSLLRQIAYPPATSGQQSKFRKITDDYEETLPKTTENKDLYLPVYDRIYNQAKGVLGFGDHGREMMDSIIKALCADPKRETVTVMEVGVWFGSSLARWLQVDPKVQVVGVDPFIAVPTQERQVKLLKPHEKKLFGKVKFNRGLTMYNVGRKLQEKSTERILAIAGFFPQAADFFFDAHHQQKGPDIDIFYLDGGKVNEPQAHMDFLVGTITKVIDEFPNVIVSGDDWQHGNQYKLFQDTIRELAAKYGRTVFLSGNRTWIMAKLKSSDNTHS